MRALSGILSGTTALFLALSPAVAEEAYSPGGGRTEITPPDTAPARAAGSAVEMLTGQPAMDRGGAPFDVCPDTGEGHFGAFAVWFAQWSLAGTFGYVMYPTGSAFKSEEHTLEAGESRSFLIGAAPVKKFAWCMFSAEGDLEQDDVAVTLTSFVTDTELCGDEPTPCQQNTYPQTPPFAPPLNHLNTWSESGTPHIQYVLEVTGPETGAVTVFIGGRLGTYPTLGLATN